MGLFRTLLAWIVLALLGALAAQFLLADPGYVLVRYGGYDRSTTLAGAIVMLAAALLAAWLVWKALALPFASFRRHRKKQARAKLIDGLDALHQGRWERAEALLAQAADDREAGTAARLAASRAAAARGDIDGARAHLAAIADDRGPARAVAQAELALAGDAPVDALAALDAPAAQPLPPRGIALRAHALAALGRSGDAYGLLGPLRQQAVLPVSDTARLERNWAEASLRDAADANVLADRWEALPKPLRSEPGAVAAYATRAAALRWDEAAARSVEQALDVQWDDSLAALYGRLPIGRLDERRAHAERWLGAHPASPSLLLTLARLARQQGQWPQAEGFLHRALAQGAGADAWEELGHGYAQAADDAHARRAYLNALRAARGEPVDELPGRDMKQRIYDQAAVEERDEHGVPRLRG